MDNKEQSLKDNTKWLSRATDFELLMSQTNIFEKDKRFFLLAKKSDKLASAVYLITDMFSDKEPLKWTLRKKAVGVVSQITKLKISKWSDKNTQLNVLQSSIIELISLLETAFLGGLVSSMNFSILSLELAKLVKQNEEYAQSDLEDKNDFNLKNELTTEDESYKGQEYIKDNEHQQRKEHEMSFKDKGHHRDLQGQNSNTKYSVTDRVSKPIITSKKRIENKEKKNDRQVKIIDLIKDKKHVSIKDISVNIKDCSEKTIQRELNSMVVSGVLKKEGEKRWSRYSLNL